MPTHPPPAPSCRTGSTEVVENYQRHRESKRWPVPAAAGSRNHRTERNRQKAKAATLVKGSKVTSGHTPPVPSPGVRRRVLAQGDCVFLSRRRQCPSDSHLFGAATNARRPSALRSGGWRENKKGNLPLFPNAGRGASLSARSLLATIESQWWVRRCRAGAWLPLLFLVQPAARPAPSLTQVATRIRTGDLRQKSSLPPP